MSSNNKKNPVPRSSSTVRAPSPSFQLSLANATRRTTNNSASASLNSTSVAADTSQNMNNNNTLSSSSCSSNAADPSNRLDIPPPLSPSDGSLVVDPSMILPTAPSSPLSTALAAALISPASVSQSSTTHSSQPVANTDMSAVMSMLMTLTQKINSLEDHQKANITSMTARFDSVNSYITAMNDKFSTPSSSSRGRVKDEKIIHSSSRTRSRSRSPVEIDREEKRVKEEEEEDIKKEKRISIAEDTDSNAFDSMNVWWSERERLYGYHDNKSKYVGRYTLCSEAGRLMEYVRFVWHCEADEELYPSVWKKIYEQLLLTRMQPSTVNNKKMRNSINFKMIEVPYTHFDERDTRYKTKNIESVDLSDHAYTFEGLSRNLFRHVRDPPSNLTIKEIIHKTLEEYIKQVTHEASSCSSHSSSMSAGYASDSSDEDRDVLLKSTRRELKLSSSYRPPDQIKRHVETIKKKIDSSVEVKTETDSKKDLPTIADAVMSLFDEGTRTTLRLTSIDRKLTHEQASREKQNIIANLNTFDGVDNDKSSIWLVAYCSAIHSVNLPPALAIQVLTQKLKGEALDWLRSMMVGVENLSPREVLTSVLLDFISHYLGPSKTEDFRRRLNAMKLQGKTTVSDLKQFNKNFMLLKNNLAMCDHNMKESAFVTLYNQALTPEIRSYIGSDWKTKTTVDSLARAAEEAVDAHTQRSFNYGKLTINNNNQRVQAEENGSSKKKETVNANANNTRRSSSPSSSSVGGTSKAYNSKYNNTDNANVAELTCFHCGNKGHRVTECHLALSKQPQTTKGKAAFASYQKDIGDIRTYDVSKFFESARRWEDRRRGYRKSPKRRDAAGSDEDAHEDEDGDERSVTEVESIFLKTGVHLSHMNHNITTENEDKELEEMLETEKQVGTPLGMRVTIAGVNAGMALVDPGAVRVLMTSTLFNRLHLNEKVHVYPLRNHWLVSSSGHEVPIIGRFKAHISSQDKLLGYNLVYIVQDKKRGVRMACDLVLGRTVLAGEYPLMNVRTGDLMNENGERMPTKRVVLNSTISKDKKQTQSHSLMNKHTPIVNKEKSISLRDVPVPNTLRPSEKVNTVPPRVNGVGTTRTENSAKKKEQ